jgi:hypothetical protein
MLLLGPHVSDAAVRSLEGAFPQVNLYILAFVITHSNHHLSF